MHCMEQTSWISLGPKELEKILSYGRNVYSIFKTNFKYCQGGNVFYFLPKVNRFLYLLLIKICKGTFIFTAFEKWYRMFSTIKYYFACDFEL